MPSTTTLSQFRTQARQRLEMEDTDFVTDGEMTALVNYELGDLYDIVVSAFEDHFITTSNLTIVAGTESYTVPTDLYILRAVYWRDTSTSPRHKLQKIALQDFAYANSEDYPVVQTGRNLRYRFAGRDMYFVPTPNQSGVVELFYIPEMTKLASADDAVTFNIPTQGWEQYVVAGVCARMLIKEESDPTPMLAEQQRIKDKISQMAKFRDSSAPDKVIDTTGRTQYWDTYPSGF